MFWNNKNNGRRMHPLKGLFFVLVFLVFVFGMSWVVMFLWNAILPEVTGVKTLTFWQAMGLLVLAKILFGGFGRRGRNWNRSKRGRWKEKWMGMSDDDRAKAKAKWKDYCNRRNKPSDQ